MSATCVMEAYAAGPCPPVQAAAVPLCPVHLAQLAAELRFVPGRHIRDNFLARADGAFVFNRKSGEVFSLNSTATFILEGLLGAKDPAELLDQLFAEFAISAPLDALRGCRQFIEEIKKLGFGENDAPA